MAARKGKAQGVIRQTRIPVAIVSKPQKQELTELLPGLIHWLRERGFEPVVDKETASYGLADVPGEIHVADRRDLPKASPALVIVLGGDGTLVAIARIFATTGTPVLSVNLGSLGFLTEVRLGELYQTLEGWLANACNIDARAMLRTELWRGGAWLATYESLNDIVLSKGAIARMGSYTIEMNGEHAASFRADGVIVSTPTGSTAYTLAANGPILTPNVDALVVTPICPHLLTLRPMVVPGSAQLTVRVDSIPDQSILTIDGQQSIVMQVGDEVRCKRSVHTVNLIRMRDSSFFDALRTKLKWSER